jgi:hypothetical protein
MMRAPLVEVTWPKFTEFKLVENTRVLRVVKCVLHVGFELEGPLFPKGKALSKGKV